MVKIEGKLPQKIHAITHISGHWIAHQLCNNIFEVMQCLMYDKQNRKYLLSSLARQDLWGHHNIQDEMNYTLSHLSDLH